MRFGLIGAGGIGQVRRAAIKNAPGCELTAVFDINKDVAKRAAGG